MPRWWRPTCAYATHDDAVAIVRRLDAIAATLATLTRSISTMSQSMQVDLDAIRAAVTTVAADVTAIVADQQAIAKRIADLEALIAAGGQITPEMQAQADALARDAAAQAQALDAARQALDGLAQPPAPPAP